jgi:hypothetical protein
MDANQTERTSSPHESPLPTLTTTDPLNAIVLNVLSPSNEVPGGRITFPRIHLDTKLSQLKIRIQNVLQAAPAPARQRLIYRGHALLNTDATLRQVLRPPGSTEPHSDTYTLHLVLPPGSVSAASAPTAAPPTAQTQAPAGLPQPLLQPGMPNGLLNMPGVQLPQQVLAQAQAAQMMLQNQLNMLHQQLGGQNQHHQQGHPHTMPGMPGMNVMPNEMQVTHQIHQHGQPGQQIPLLPGFGFGPNAANFQALMQPQQQMPQPPLAGHPPMATPGQPVAEPSHPNLREASNQSDALATDTPGANGPTPVEQPPVTTRVQETIGPQGQRIRTVVRESINMTISSRHGTPSPATSRPSAGTAPNSFTMDTAGMNAPRSSPSPAPGLQASQSRAQSTRHTPLPFMMPPPMPNISASPSTTMAWILSSPNGPEALLFAPGHGYFSSALQQTPSRLSPTRTIVSQEQNSQIGNVQDLAAAARDGAAAQQPGQVQQAQALARLPHPDAIPARQPAGENNFFNFIIGRAWLFLRMYVFTFFISEPGTLRRYLLLVVATLICILPRDNVLQQFATQVRRHIDTLIGPPAAPARDGAAALAQTNAVTGTAAPGDVQAVENLTPAENAARLLREHHARNPNVFRDALFRIERAAALFLASLVPGVGERHVRAREDQRREAERLENERRPREEAERTQAQAEADGTQVGSADAGSTAVEMRDHSREARERTTQAQAVETGA